MVLTPYVLVILGTSLSTGRLAASDQSWVPTLQALLRDQPEAKGPVIVHNMGKGSQNSAWGVTQTPLISALRPTHVLMEGFAINDCIDFGGGPAISRAQHIINIQTMVADLRTNNPGVIITIQTMNPVSAAGAAVRPQLVDYYADEIATATTLGCGVLDNYGGTITVPGGWPKPLPNNMSNGGGPFQIPARAGYTGMSGAAVWNAADMSAKVTLGDADHTAFANVPAGVGSVRANEAILTATKKHFEIRPTVAAPYPSLGIALASAPLNQLVGIGANGVGIDDAGRVNINGGFVGNSGIGQVSGQPLAFEIDRVANLFYVGNSVTWSAGFDISALGAGPLFPMISVGSIGSGGTARFSEDGDGLHPLWTGGLDTYLFPNVLALSRAQMAALWP